MSTVHYTYILFDIFGTPRYVGKGKGSRWTHHETRPSANWLKNGFIEQATILLGEVPKIKVRENISEDDAVATEISLIKAIGRMPNGPLTNLTDGGDGLSGYRQTAQHRAAIRKALTGRRGVPHTLEWREMMSARMTGRPKSPESIAKSAAKRRGLKRTAAQCRAASDSRKGKPLHPAFVAGAAVSVELRRGQPRTDEHRKNLSNSQKGRPGLVGEKNSNAKISDKAAAEVIQECLVARNGRKHLPPGFLKTMSIKYGVSVHLVTYLLGGRAWRRFTEKAQ
jgi:hypothetical protein